VFGALALLWCSGAEAEPKDGEKKILIFGDPNSHNPQWQKDLMERSLQQVARAFKASSFEIDLIPTTEVSPSIIKERLVHYAGSLSTNDTFVMYSHSHGTRRGTYFSSWPDLAESVLAIPARNVVILTMSCASGNLTDTFASMKSRWEGRSNQGRSLIILTPVAAEQKAGPSPEPGIGNPFSYAVATAAQGAADGISGAKKNGQIEMNELVDYVLKTTHEKSRWQSQRPQFAGEFPVGAVLLSLHGVDRPASE
jgi:hypothetical protein